MTTRMIGSFEWAEQTGGRLSEEERARFQAAISQVSRQLHQLSRADVIPTERIDLLSLRMPDTQGAREAMQWCEQVTSSSLFNHALRTYVWGALLAQQDRIRYESELLFMAALLHDVGLTAACAFLDPTAQCYAVEGGRAAGRLLERMGWEQERCQAVQEAIFLHLNVEVSLLQGAEAHLLHEGVLLDIVGGRLQEIPAQMITWVLEHYPRLDFKREFIQALEEQVTKRPDSRITLLVRDKGLFEAIRQAPLP
jgi:hypothetical protein